MLLDSSFCQLIVITFLLFLFLRRARCFFCRHFLGFSVVSFICHVSGLHLNQLRADLELGHNIFHLRRIISGLRSRFHHHNFEILTW